jgi:hypothetical protein
MISTKFAESSLGLLDGVRPFQKTMKQVVNQLRGCFRICFVAVSASLSDSSQPYSGWRWTGSGATAKR